MMDRERETERGERKRGMRGSEGKDEWVRE